jgi:hypothetical protein
MPARRKQHGLIKLSLVERVYLSIIQTDWRLGPELVWQEQESLPGLGQPRTDHRPRGRARLVPWVLVSLLGQAY